MSSSTRPSLDDWILATLRGAGPKSLDELGDMLPGTNWAQLYLSVDRLSRMGKLTLSHPSGGGYILSLAPQGRARRGKTPEGQVSKQ